MADEVARVVLVGSERQAPSDELAGALDLEARITLSVYLRGPEAPEGARSREEYAAAFGAAEPDVAALRRFAEGNGLGVGRVDAARRRVELSGSLRATAAAFRAEVALHRAADGTLYRAQHGALQLPVELDGLVTGVLGFDERPQARPHFEPRPNAAAPYTPLQVAAGYAYPAGLTGKGQCIALIELGGGFLASDLSAYFSSLGLPEPAVVAEPVDGGANRPGGAADGEVMLDIEVAGAIAPEAEIVVYFAPNTDQGFIDAVSQAAHDAAHRPSVISISWGGPESSWSGQAMAEMERTLSAAAAMGVTVTVAAGDNGSSDGVGDGLQHVDFPASAPHALACGGTRLALAAATIESETVWNDGPGQGATGGGISDVFALPAYQSAAGVPPSANPGGHVGRGVPDVAGDADPDTGYLVRVDGQIEPIGGTSAVAPLWAGLIARLNEGLGRPVGFLQPFLYSSGRQGLHDVTSGSNGAYSAGPGWDACTGLGSPDGTALLAALRAAGALG